MAHYVDTRIYRYSRLNDALSQRTRVHLQPARSRFLNRRITKRHALSPRICCLLAITYIGGGCCVYLFIVIIQQRRKTEKTTMCVRI